MLKKLIIGFAVLTTLISFTAQIASAEDALSEVSDSGASTPTTDDEPSDLEPSSLDSFDVSIYLTIPSEGDDDPSAQGQEYMEGKTGSPIMDFILMIINTLLMVIGTACMVLIIIGGVLMMSSEGDDNRIQKGKTILTQAIIGLVIAFTSYVLVTFVQSLLYV